MKRVAEIITGLFVVWIILAATAAFVWPVGFAWFKPWIVPALGIVMFGMGVTLTPADFKRVAERPYAVVIGTLAQFLIMPATGALLAKLLHLSPPLAAGLILVGACPGGTASNVITFLAKADVALAVTLTAITTVLGAVATPYLTLLYAGQYVAVPAWEMLWSVAKIVVIPVILGVGVRQLLGEKIRVVMVLMPVVSITFIALIVATIVAISKDRLAGSAPTTFLAVVLHNALGMMLGYGFARLTRLDQKQARTIAIEVSVQDSGLGIALAQKHFTDVLVTLPSAIFSVWQNVIGPVVATYWSRRPPQSNA
jgi:BASS family bile acid:Na+ symporter